MLIQIRNKKLAMVNSHERSGTHFLMNTLEENFHFTAVPWIDLDMPYNPWQHENLIGMMREMRHHEGDNIIKSHYEGTFWHEALIDEIFDNFYIFYIQRNMEDTLRSCVTHFNDLYWDGGPKVDNVEEMMKAEPSGSCIRFQYRQYPTMVDRWKAHIKGWTEDMPQSARDRIVYVQYEDLNERFDETIERISNQMELRIFADKPIRPPKHRFVKGGAFVHEIQP